MDVQSHHMFMNLVYHHYDSINETVLLKERSLKMQIKSSLIKTKSTLYTPFTTVPKTVVLFF